MDREEIHLYQQMLKESTFRVLIVNLPPIHVGFLHQSMSELVKSNKLDFQVATDMYAALMLMERIDFDMVMLGLDLTVHDPGEYTLIDGLSARKTNVLNRPVQLVLVGQSIDKLQQFSIVHLLNANTYVNIDKYTQLPSAIVRAMNGEVIEPGNVDVLVVDDVSELQYCDVIDKMPGFASTGCKTAFEAKTAFREHEYDIAVVDIVLDCAGPSGIDLMRDFSHEQPRLAIVVVSGNMTESYYPLFAEFGVMAILPKPFSDTEFRKTIQRTVYRAARAAV